MRRVLLAVRGGLSTVRQAIAFYFVVLLLGTVQLGWFVPAFLIRHAVSPERGRRIGRRVISSVFRRYFDLTRLCGVLEVDCDAVDAIDPHEALIIAPNHPSGLDALILISRLPYLNCIMKASMLDNILLGAGSRLAGYIRNDGPRRMFRLSTEDLKAGGQLIIFPEATRTVAAPVNAFKGGFASMAKVAGVPIQTVIVETDTPFLAKGWSVMRKPPRLPMRYRVRLGRRFDVPVDAHVASFVAELRDYFIAELDGAQLGDLWDVERAPDAKPSPPVGDARGDTGRALPWWSSSRSG